MRVFELMVRNLPPGNPAQREVAGSPWGDVENLLWDIDAQLRVIVTFLTNIGSKSPKEPKFLPHPEREQESTTDDENRTITEREDLQKVLARQR